MSAFEKEFLCEDIENLLINHEEMSLYLKKLKENCADFTAKLEHKIKDSILKNSGNLNNFFWRFCIYLLHFTVLCNK